MLKTIREVFSFNLRRVRGDRTQAEMAEFLGIPLRTYGRLESDNLPQEATLEVLVQKTGVSEVEYFQDPDWHPSPTPEECLEVLAKAIEHYQSVSPKGRQHSQTVSGESPLKSKLLAEVSALEDYEIEALLSALGGIRLARETEELSLTDQRKKARK